ncbi:MAG: Antitermination regulatory protein [Rhodoglobus sp.]|nr:Antitermination regulatory protein [Rhodoglobus sp.]
MSIRRAFSDARGEILEAQGSELAAPFVAAFPVDGASVSVLAGPVSGLTVAASDDVANRLDELQFDLGEGPCWTALAHRLPVLMDARAQNADWPMFREAVASDAIAGRVRTMFAFPLAIGALDIGAIDLYSGDSSPLSPELVSEASSLADIAAWRVLRTILNDHTQGYDSESIGYSRREVHQATGMIIVQLGVTPEDAELLLRAHAFAGSRTVRDVAKDVVERRLDFATRGTD